MCKIQFMFRMDTKWYKITDPNILLLGFFLAKMLKTEPFYNYKEKTDHGYASFVN